MNNTSATKATRINLFSFATPHMRAFHLSWLAFFVCFFAWFAVAPLMPVIKGVFGLNKDQIANIGIAAVAVTVLMRMIVGPLCDRFGPRMVYTALLALGAIPVFGIALAQSYATFLVFRLAIGVIGASFVLTQYHTSVMFAPNVVGTANAATAGWGNSGGGVTQTVMPLIFAAILGFGLSQTMAWRWAMIVPGTLMLLVALLYWRFTQDCPAGNYSDMRKAGLTPDTGNAKGWRVFATAAANYRVWLLFLAYAACFGIELFVHNTAASYYVDRFHLTLSSAGAAAGSFGLLALFARALGGYLSDRFARRAGLDSRRMLLCAVLLAEGVGLVIFSRMGDAAFAVAAMVSFGLFTHMACGATFALVPFIDRKALGGVAGIVGAGGNVGAVGAGFLLKAVKDTPSCFGILGFCVIACAVCTIAIRFSQEHKAREEALFRDALGSRGARPIAGASPAPATTAA